MSDSRVKLWSARSVRMVAVLLVCVAQYGCSSSSGPGTSTPNSHASTVADVVGPSVGSVYVFQITYTDTSGKTLLHSAIDTCTVVADTLTLYGRTDVAKVQDKFGTRYYAFDANGDFYSYDTVVPYEGWHRYPVGTHASLSENYDSIEVLLGDTIWDGFATVRYVGAGSVEVGSAPLATENAYEDYSRGAEYIDDRSGLQYAPSITFYTKLADTTFWYSSKAPAPEVVTRTLEGYSLR